MPHRVVVLSLLLLLPLLLLGKHAEGRSVDPWESDRPLDWNFDDYAYGVGDGVSLAGYDFQFELSDLSSIDLDQLAFEDRLRAAATAGNLASAKAIFERGGYAKPVAVLRIKGQLDPSLELLSSVEGFTNDGTPVGGSLLDWSYSRPLETTELSVVYEASTEGCSVGGLPDPRLIGCFGSRGEINITENHNAYDSGGGGEDAIAESGGTITLQYEHDPRTETYSRVTLQGLGRIPMDVKETYEKYLDYWGSADYADEWIEALLSGEPNPEEWHITIPFEEWSPGKRAEAAKIATVSMSVWMAVVSHMEIALDVCEYPNESDRAVREFEKAVALYIGGLEAEGYDLPDWKTMQMKDIEATGTLLYALAAEHCVYFNTCDGETDVNNAVLSDMKLVSEELSKTTLVGESPRHCSLARGYVERIVKFMTIPLFQGMVRNVYSWSRALYSETLEPGWGSGVIDKNIMTHSAKSQAFTASFLPLIHACDREAAVSIHEEIFEEYQKVPDWEKYRNAVETVMNCLDLSPEEVGGLWNPVTQEYYVGAEPFRQTYRHISKGERLGILIVPAVIIIALIGFCCWSVRYKQRQKEWWDSFRKSKQDKDRQIDLEENSRPKT